MTATSWARVVLVVLTALVLQVAVIDQIVVAGAHADVMVLLAGAAGLLAGPERGAVVGFVAGIAADLVVPTPFGLSSLTFVLVGFGFGLVASSPAVRDARGVKVAACVLSGTVGTVLYAFIGALVGQSGMLGRTGADAAVAVTVGGLVLAWPAVAAAGWALRGGERALGDRGVPSGGSAAL